MKTFKKSICVILALICVISITACGNSVNKDGLWESATYLKDTTLGTGKNSFVLEVKAGEQSVKFTVNTDKEMVGEALLDNKIIEGEDGQYGLYVKKVNGILADYDTDQSYWGFYINGEYATSGVDTTKIEKDAAYKFEYTK